MSHTKVKLSVGVFILTVFVSIVIFLFLLFQEKGTFQSRYSFQFTAYSSNPFTIGMPIKFSGFNIGVVEKIELLDTGAVNITFSVDDKNRKWITKDSVLVTLKPLIGMPVIEISPSFDSPLLKEGSSLLLVMSDDINDMITRFEPSINNLVNIVNNLNTMTNELSKDNSDLFTSLDNIKQLTNQLNNISNSLPKTLINPASSMLEDINIKLKYLDNTVKVVGGYDKELVEIKEQISLGLQKSNELIEKVDSMFQDVPNSKIELP